MSRTVGAVKAVAPLPEDPLAGGLTSPPDSSRPIIPREIKTGQGVQPSLDAPGMPAGLAPAPFQSAISASQPEPKGPAEKIQPAPMGEIVSGLARSAADGNLDRTLPGFYDHSQPIRTEYADFLSRIGFRDYPREIQENLKSGDLAPLQKKVLEFNAKRYQTLNAARDYASEVMAGLSEQGFSEDSLERGTELAARLLSLQPLDAPSALPAEIAKKDEEGIIQWLVAVTVQKLGAQLAQTVSDTVKTLIEPRILARRLEALRREGDASPEAKALLTRVSKLKAQLETLLVTMYTDAEIGQTRYAGRALAASLVRYARLENRPKVEEKLKAKLLERNLYLENFVGDTLVLHDDSSPDAPKRINIQTGDFLGERSGGREAAEITFAVRPNFRLWLKAWRQKLLGSPIGLWANPRSSPRLVPGQGLLNRLKLAWRAVRQWLAEREILRRGYSHVGMAWVEAADGVSMAWAMDNYPNSGEGGIRKIGITEQFAQSGPYLRLGIGRLGADKVWKTFQEQALEGFRPTVYDSDGGQWPSGISPEDYKALARFPASQSRRLLGAINERAVRVIEQMLLRWGVAFAYGFNNEIWRAYCSSTMMLAHRMGSQFEIQAYHDHWHPLVRLLKKLGLAAKDQNTESRIIWPGSFFIDPKVSRHLQDTYPPFTGIGRFDDPSSLPAYVEMDRELTKSLTALLQLSPEDENGIHPDEDIIDYAVRSHLDARADKQRAKRSYSSGASRSGGYSAGLEELLSEEEY